ncbi:hypothetical protein [Acrocarpospora sp. B8E8]|uniref:hypothetical protein n=1 Tax=Acrocarpospora sp. B8E8 TaxID=3153572 RepID=UPI00325F816F
MLRRQDDQFGSNHVHHAARAQLRLIVSTLQESSYTLETGRRLYAAGAEAARQCGWTAYDSGRPALAEEYYLAALRAARTADDPAITANVLSFWAIARYSTGDPNGAVDLVTKALGYSGRIGSPRMDAMLQARLARAYARAGDSHASAHAQNAATDAYDRARDTDPSADPDYVYWVNWGELLMLHGSSDLNLGQPKDALHRFETAEADARPIDTYQEGQFPRGAAIYLARPAEAQIALGDLDGAVATADRAVSRMGGVDSVRGTGALTDLRNHFLAQRDVPLVANFLDRTASATASPL